MHDDPLIDALNALPDTEPVPPALQDRVLGVPSRPRGRGTWVAAVAAGWMVAAGALLWPAHPAPEVFLGLGSEEVSGEALVHVGDLSVAVDGRVGISVEPHTALPRVGVQEEPMSATKYALSALAGAAVTITVYEGAARILGDTPVTVEAGQTHTVASSGAVSDGDEPRGRPIRVRLPFSGAAGADSSEAITAALAERVAALEEENERLRFQSAMATGQLAQIQGEPVAWPDDAGLFEPEVFSAAIEDVVANHPDLSVLDIDCQEFPCLAFIDVAGGPPGNASDIVDPFATALGAGEGEDDPGMMAMIQAIDGDGGTPATTMVLALVPNEDPHGPVATRIEGRVRNHMDGVRPDQEDVEIR